MGRYDGIGLTRSAMRNNAVYASQRFVAFMIYLRMPPIVVPVLFQAHSGRISPACEGTYAM
jgi:hypothetical protein